MYQGQGHDASATYDDVDVEVSNSDWIKQGLNPPMIVYSRIYCEYTAKIIYIFNSTNIS